MRKLTVFRILGAIALFALILVSSATAELQWPNLWAKVGDGWAEHIDGQLTSDLNFGSNQGVTIFRRAFGAQSTIDKEVTDTDLMPGVGKLDLGCKRLIDAHTYEIQGSFSRPFRLTEGGSWLTMWASANGQFIPAAGQYLAEDYAKGLANGWIVGKTWLTVGYYDNWSRQDSYTGDLTFFLPAGDYTFHFFYNAEVHLGGIDEDSAETLEANFFNSYNAGIFAVPEPATLTLLGLGSLAMFRRRTRAT